jgi:alpha-methylacyl-CoA racemase
MESWRQGPLAGIRVVEFAGIGPAPMCAMLLADLGAEVIAIERLEPAGTGIPRPREFDVCRRSRRSIAIDLKTAEGVACALDLIARADAVIEGFRPGVMERLGLGPGACCERNPRLVYGRLTGWGQDGPLAEAAGHDLNYVAITGALAQIGRDAGQPPAIPLNLIGDYGGGGMLLAFGLVCALLEATRSGKGQVVDAAMIDGAATLMSAIYGLAAAGIHLPPRGSNVLDGGAPFYNVYQCADGEWVTVAAIEPKFRDVLLHGLGFASAEFPDPDDRAQWPQGRQLMAERFAQRSRDEWCDLLLGSDACFAPMLGCGEAPAFAQNRAREVFVDVAGVVQPAPSPRFSRTAAGPPTPPEEPGASTHAVLAAWGFAPEQISALAARSIIPSPPGEADGQGSSGRL